MREFHPAADLFPMMGEEEYEALKSDIQENGLREAIWIDREGKIIDGRNRYQACKELGIETRYRAWDGKGSLLALIISLNLYRRHLTSSQQAVIAVEALPMLEAEAKKRMLAGIALDPTETIPGGEARERAAELFQTNPRYVSDAKRLQRDAPDLLERVRTGERSIPQAKQELNRRQRVENAQKLARMPERAYNVILADPPWEYSNTGVIAAASRHYTTMNTEKICQFLEDVELRVAKDAVLFLWVTNPLIEDALKVIRAWGFNYKTNAVWIKTDLKKPGTGFYVRGQHELLFICTKGNFTPLETSIVPPIGSVIRASVREHSRKPDLVYSMIERLYPQCSYVELFARSGSRKGWDVHGYEVGKFTG